MLKLIYTETAVHLELLAADLDHWVKQRLSFASSTGETMFVSSEKANFLLPETICEVTAVNSYLRHQGVNTVTVNYCDFDRVEIGLAGYWLSTDPDSAEGILVTKLPDQVEAYLWQLWSSADSQLVVSDEVMG
jgi:hypothetical protein